jgi:hypothetical protein
MTAPAPRLISELRRLFLPTSAQASLLTALEAQLTGGPGAALPADDGQGRTRLMVVGFHGVSRGQGDAHCTALLQCAKALMEELGLPEAAFSVNGREGYDLWLPLADAVPLADAADFLRLLQQAYLKELPALSLWPAAGAPTPPLCLPPRLHPDTGLWSVFIAPGLAPSFSEEAGLDLPVNPDKQADLLARLAPIAPDAFNQAWQRLRERVDGVAAPALVSSSAEPTGLGEVPATPGPTAAEAAPGPQPLASQREALLRGLSQTAQAVVATPFAGLTSLLHGGWRGGRLVLLLGAPKSGKTTLAAMCLDHAAANGHPALYVGYEMAAEQLVHAALARRLRLDARRIEAGLLAPEESVRVAAALEAYLAREGPLLALWEAGAATCLADVAAWVRAAREQHPGKTPLVVLDPLPLARTGQPAREAHPDAAHRLAALAAAAKQLARSTGAAVLAPCPVPRPPEGGAELLADREALPLLGAADGVLVLQDAAARGADDAPQRLSLSLPLHRGRTGSVLLDHWRAWHLMEEAGLAEA